MIDTMYKWQKDLWAACAGSDPREMKIIMSGRQIGKSVMAQMWNQVQAEPIPEYCKIIDKSKVDTKQFYTIQCSRAIADWVRQQPGEDTQWYQHIDHNWIMDRTKFDIDEDLYLMLKLRWGC